MNPKPFAQESPVSLLTAIVDVVMPTIGLVGAWLLWRELDALAAAWSDYKARRRPARD